MVAKEQVMKDAKYFKGVFRELSEEGCFSDRFPNFGEEYDTEAELRDLIRYQETIKKPESLSFWRNQYGTEHKLV